MGAATACFNQLPVSLRKVSLEAEIRFINNRFRLPRKAKKAYKKVVYYSSFYHGSIDCPLEFVRYYNQSEYTYYLKAIKPVTHFFNPNWCHA